MNNETQWTGGAPSFRLTVSPEDTTALLHDVMTAAITAEENSTQRLRLALALEWLNWKLARKA